MRTWYCAFLALVLAVGSADAQWVEQPGQGWADVTIYHLDTREAFEFNGDLDQLFAEGHAVSTAAFVTVAAGVVPGVDVWVQAPYQRLRYDDARDDRLRSGIGDSRVYVRVSPLRLLGSVFPLAVRAGAKVPVGDFDVDSEIIPLGDGQTDWEVMTEVGHSFYPLPVYVNGWLGYRWRNENREARRDFGDEAFFLAQVGANRGPLGFQLVFEGMESVTTPVIEGIRLPNAERSVYQLTPRVAYDVGPGALSLGARFALSGQNLPAGTSLVFGYFTRWSLPR